LPTLSLILILNFFKCPLHIYFSFNILRTKDHTHKNNLAEQVLQVLPVIFCPTFTKLTHNWMGFFLELTILNVTDLIAVNVQNWVDLYRISWLEIYHSQNKIYLFLSVKYFNNLILLSKIVLLKIKGKNIYFPYIFLFEYLRLKYN
jgi:hypothetical protein